MYFSVVCALQEAKRSAKRLRSVLFGKRPESSPEASSASGHAASEGPKASAVRDAAADGAGATGPQAPPGAAAEAGATRVACRHEAWAVGQRGPGCGQGNRSARPTGVAGRLEAMPGAGPGATRAQSGAARRAGPS